MVALRKEEIPSIQVQHPLWYKSAFGSKPRFTPVQSLDRAHFIARFWANKYLTPVYIYTRFGYSEIQPDSLRVPESQLRKLEGIIRTYSVETIRHFIIEGRIDGDMGTVLLDTNDWVQRDFIKLLELPLETRRNFIIKVAKEIYQQWYEHHMIELEQL